MRLRLRIAGFVAVLVLLSASVSRPEIGSAQNGGGAQAGAVQIAQAEAYEYVELHFATALDDRGHGANSIKYHLKNNDIVDWDSFTWWFSWSSGEYYDIAAWDAEGPLDFDTYIDGTTIYITVYFRSVLQPGQSYSYWLSLTIGGMAGATDGEWEAAWTWWPGAPIAEFKQQLTLPTGAQATYVYPTPNSNDGHTMQWIYYNRPADWSIYFDIVYAMGCAPGTVPVILVHGWHASTGDDLAHDYQMNLFANMLRADGYVDGQTLFYATGINEKNPMVTNAYFLQQTVRRAQQASGCSTFNIVAHSFGGLNTRAYLETSRYQEDRDQRGIRISNAFIIGTPNGGVEPDGVTTLFGLLGAAADGKILNDIMSIAELSPDSVRWWNERHSQPAGVEYHLISGDVTWHWLARLILGSDPTDGLATRASVHALGGNPNYQSVILRSTSDLHGCWDRAKFLGIYGYNCPESTTYETYIAPYLGGNTGLADVSPLDRGDLAAGKGISAVQQGSGIARTPLVTGVITTGQIITGTAHMDSVGTGRFYLTWTKGDLDLSLIDPLGRVITASADIDPNIDFFSLQTDALFNYEAYVITDTLAGSWTLTVAAIDTYSQQVPFAAFAIPDSALTFTVSTDQDWYPKNQEAVITATLALSTTPVTDATVQAKVYRPDTIADTLTLYDDGAHNDGSVADGIYGNSYPSTDVGGYYAVLGTAKGNLEGSDYERGAETGFSVSPETASLTGIYSDYPEDADSNGKYEHLVVNVGIDVGQSGSFELSAKLLDVNGALVVGSSDYISLPVGTQDVPLRFDGETIRDHGVDGPYTVTDVFLFDASGVAVKLAEAHDVWTTAAYDHNMFGNDWLIYLPLITKNY